MNIKTIEMRGFTKHANTLVKLPQRGVVLITGPNGAGKSSFIEAVSMSFWGETLRGSDPFNGDGEVEVMTDLASARRKRAGKRTTLRWIDRSVETGAEGTYENTTKAQEAVEQVIGSFDMWRRTHVFSSQDAAHFTMATDSERKRLLESVLELTKFDAALEACRSDRREFERKLAAAEATLASAHNTHESEKVRVTDAERVLASIVVPAVADYAQEYAAMRKMVEAADSDINGINNKLSELSRTGFDDDAKAREIERRLLSLNAKLCDRCSQVIPQSLRDVLKQEIDRLRTEAKKARDMSHGLAVDLQLEVADLREEREALRDKAAALKARSDEAARVAATHAAATTSFARAKAQVQAALQSITQQESLLADLQQRLAVLSAAESVLGMKGVRAHVLGQALGGIEQMANSWLLRLGLDMKLSLKPYTEKKSGGVTDAISLDVEGAGGGHGYRGASGGERRRIDVAILFALAAVAAAAAGRTPGTLWLDEVFDAIDEDGTEAVCTALADLAKDRAVVVITHNKALTERLDAVLRLRIDGGAVAA